MRAKKNQGAQIPYLPFSYQVLRYLVTELSTEIVDNSYVQTN